MMQSTKKLPKKRQKKPSRRVDKRTRQALNGSVFRVRGHCGALGEITKALYPDELAEAALTSETTSYRWIKEKKLPDVIQALLEHRVLGLIHDEAFEGWHVRDGALVTPSGWSITPGEIDGLTLIHQQNSWQSLRIAEQDAKIKRLEEAVELWRERAGQMPGANDSEWSSVQE